MFTGLLQRVNVVNNNFLGKRLWNVLMGQDNFIKQMLLRYVEGDDIIIRSLVD